jgi:eukaryotic-like serine/threonine-protein kinase
LTAPVLEHGRYELGSVLGRGGMALVYLARDRERDRPVAIKLLADNLAADPELRRRFAREAELAERLSHPNVLRVLDSGETGGRAFIVLEYVEGRNLAEELHRDGPLAPARVAELGSQAAAALAHAHERGLVHRDVKPQNLLLTKDGTLKVSDFGIARVVDGTQLTQVGTVLGTAAYLAPEQAAGEEATAAADVYSLGAVLYELLTGRPPYDASSLAEFVLRRGDGDPPPPSALAPDVPAGLDALVLACLREDPAERPTAREVELMLRGELEPPTQVLTRAPQRPTTRLRRTGRRRRWVLAGGVLAVLAATAVALGVTLGGGGATPKPAPPRRIAAIPPAPTAAGEAANLARWLRSQSR